MKKKKYISLLLCFVILVSTVIYTYIGYFYGAGEGQVGVDMYGINYLKAFTVDSNIIGAIVSLISIFYLFKDSKKLYPKWLVNLQLVASSVLSLTFLVVVFFLGVKNVIAGKSYFLLFEGDMLFFHLINPISMLIIFFMNKDYKLINKSALLSLIPLVLYMICYCLGVIVFKNWYDIYGFLFNGKYYLTLVAFIFLPLFYFGIIKLLIKYYNKK